MGWQSESDMLIEVHHEYLVLRIAGTREGHSRCDYFGTLGRHAAAVIDDQPYSHRNIFVTEILDLLWNAILEYLKIALAEAGYETAFTVLNRGVKVHHANV